MISDELMKVPLTARASERTLGFAIETLYDQLFSTSSAF